jgi:hypothetical protein
MMMNGDAINDGSVYAILPYQVFTPPSSNSVTAV